MTKRKKPSSEAPRAARMAPVDNAVDRPAEEANSAAVARRYTTPGPGNSGRSRYHILSKGSNVVLIGNDGDRGDIFVTDLTFVWKKIVCLWFDPKCSAYLIKKNKDNAVDEHREAVNELRKGIEMYFSLRCCDAGCQYRPCPFHPAEQMTKMVFVEKAKLGRDDIPANGPVFVKELPPPGCVAVEYVEAPDWKVLAATSRIHVSIKYLEFEHKHVVNFVRTASAFLVELPRAYHRHDNVMELQRLIMDLEERDNSYCGHFHFWLGPEKYYIGGVEQNKYYLVHMYDKTELQARKNLLEKLKKHCDDLFRELPFYDTKRKEIDSLYRYVDGSHWEYLGTKGPKGPLARFRDYETFERLVEGYKAFAAPPVVSLSALIKGYDASAVAPFNAAIKGDDEAEGKEEEREERSTSSHFFSRFLKDYLSTSTLRLGSQGADTSDVSTNTYRPRSSDVPIGSSWLGSGQGADIETTTSSLGMVSWRGTRWIAISLKDIDYSPVALPIDDVTMSPATLGNVELGSWPGHHTLMDQSTVDSPIDGVTFSLMSLASLNLN